MTNFNEQPSTQFENGGEDELTGKTPSGPSLRLVKNEDDAPLPATTGVTPEQRKLYEEAHRIFGEGAHRPDAPGQPVRRGSMDNLQRAKLRNRMASHAIELASILPPKLRDVFLKRHGIDPKSPDISKATGGLRLTSDEEDVTEN